jgi:hypothetical protein
MILNESSVEFRYTQGPAVINGQVVAGGPASLYSGSPGEGDDYECPDDSHIDTSEGEDTNRDTYGKMSRLLNAASMTVPNSDKAVDHATRATTLTEKGAGSHALAALEHEKRGRQAVKNKDESAGDHFRVASAHRQLSRVLTQLAKKTKLTSNSRRPTIPSAGGTPLFANRESSVVFNATLDSPDRMHSFDQAPGSQTGAGELRSGGSRFADEREAPPRRSIKKPADEGQEGDEPQSEAELSAPFDGRGLTVTKRKKGSKRSVTDPRGHPSSGGNFEEAAAQPRKRLDMDDLNEVQLNALRSGLAINARYRGELRRGCLPHVSLCELMAAERRLEAPGLAQ